jgi:hypothetical protein
MATDNEPLELGVWYSGDSVNMLSAEGWLSVSSLYE